MAISFVFECNIFINKQAKYIQTLQTKCYIITISRLHRQGFHLIISILHLC